MPATLTDAQLKAALTNEQIVAARTKGVSAADTVDPVAEEITAALAKVDTFAAGYEVPAGMLTGWARDLAAHNVAKRLGTPTADQIRTYERANKELEDLRDGKFKNIPKTNTESGKVLHGSKTNILP
jgi:hypothetical protein